MKERNTILALKYLKTYESSGKKDSEIYRYKLGLDRRDLQENTSNSIIGQDSINKGADNQVDKEDDIVSRNGTLETQEFQNEFLPQIRDRSQTIHSKTSDRNFKSIKTSRFISKQHQAYSIIRYKESKNSPQSIRKLALSRIESNHRNPLTSFDRYDDEILKAGGMNRSCRAASNQGYSFRKKLKPKSSVQHSDRKSLNRISKKKDLEIKNI